MNIFDNIKFSRSIKCTRSEDGSIWFSLNGDEIRRVCTPEDLERFFYSGHFTDKQKRILRRKLLRDQPSTSYGLALLTLVAAVTSSIIINPVIASISSEPTCVNEQNIQADAERFIELYSRGTEEPVDSPSIKENSIPYPFSWTKH